MLVWVSLCYYRYVFLWIGLPVMPGKCLSSRLVTVCEDIILLGAAGSNVRISLCSLFSSSHWTCCTRGSYYHLKEGKQIPCGAGLLLFGKTLLRTVHFISLFDNINILSWKVLLLVYSGYVVSLLLFDMVQMLWPMQRWKSSLRACEAPRTVGVT